MPAALFQNVDVFLSADVLEDLGPDRDADLSEMGLLQQQHQGTRLADTAADAEGNFMVMALW